MAHTCAYFLIALIMFATAKPLSHGQGGLTGWPLLSGGPVPISDIPPPLLDSILPLLQFLNVTGTLCCTPTGNCPGQPLSVAPVNLNCNTLTGGSVILGQGKTDTNGFFNIIAGDIQGTNILPLQCNTTVELPALSTVNGDGNQVLTGAAMPNNIEVGDILGLGLNLSAGP